jgi:hypothetical protein
MGDWGWKRRGFSQPVGFPLLRNQATESQPRHPFIKVRCPLWIRVSKYFARPHRSACVRKALLPQPRECFGRWNEWWRERYKRALDAKKVRAPSYSEEDARVRR